MKLKHRSNYSTPTGVVRVCHGAAHFLEHLEKLEFGGAVLAFVEDSESGFGEAEEAAILRSLHS